MHKQLIKLSLQGCCGSGADVERLLTKKQHDSIKQLAEELSQNDGKSSYFTVPFFYVSDWKDENYA